jgi:hypothetical protein
MKVKLTDIHEYKEAVQYTNQTTSGMNKIWDNLFDLLDELEMVGFVYCDDVQ